MKKILGFIKAHIILFIIAIFIIVSTIAVLFIKDSRLMNNISKNNQNDEQLLEEENIDPLQRQREITFEEISKVMQQEDLILRDIEFEEDSYNVVDVLVEKKTTETKYNWGATRIPEESYNLLDSEHKKTITSVYGPAYITVTEDIFIIIPISESEKLDETSLGYKKETSLEKIINDNKWEGFKYSWKETLLLNKLNFDIRLNSNGSMEVTEIWEIDIKDTNTLFKTFKWDDITNVNVSEIKENGEKKEFSKINEEMYHVTENCFYALKNRDEEFEIAWGVNAQNEKKKYQISYTVDNAVKVYNDCSELYWQFIGNSFSIPVESIKGKIIILNEEQNIDGINYWLHSNSKGTIKKDNTIIAFSGEDIGRKERLEIRLAMPKGFFKNDNIINKDRLVQIQNQEKEVTITNNQNTFNDVNNATNDNNKNEQSYNLPSYVTKTNNYMTFNMTISNFVKKLNDMSTYNISSVEENDFTYIGDVPQENGITLKSYLYEQINPANGAKNGKGIVLQIAPNGKVASIRYLSKSGIYTDDVLLQRILNVTVNNSKDEAINIIEKAKNNLEQPFTSNELHFGYQYWKANGIPAFELFAM